MYHLVFMTVHSINHLDTFSTKTGSIWKKYFLLSGKFKFTLKVRKYQKEIVVSSILPTNQRKQSPYFFLFDHFLDAMEEGKEIFCCFFGWIEDTTISF